MVENIYNRLLKHKAEIVMGLKVLALVSFIVISVLMLPQIFSVQEEVEIASIYCLDHWSNKPPINFTKDGFVARAFSVYDCNVTITSSVIENLTKCNISFVYDNNKINTVIGLNRTLLKLNRDGFVTTGVPLEPFYPGNYTGKFIINCQTASNNIFKDESIERALRFLSDEDYVIYRFNDVIAELQDINAKLKSLELIDYDEIKNIPITVAFISGFFVLFGILIGNFIFFLINRKKTSPSQKNEFHYEYKP